MIMILIIVSIIFGYLARKYGNLWHYNKAFVYRNFLEIAQLFGKVSDFNLFKAYIPLIFGLVSSSTLNNGNTEDVLHDGNIALKRLIFSLRNLVTL